MNCEKCDKVFHSQYAIDSHNCAKKWCCDKYLENMINFHNYQKHIQAGFKLHKCNYCLVSMYGDRKYTQHKRNCNIFVCKECMVLIVKA